MIKVSEIDFGIQSGTAETLFYAVKSFLGENKIPYKNVVGLGTNNASVNMSEYEGIRTKLKRIGSNIMVQECVSYSVHLGAFQCHGKLPNTVGQLVICTIYFSNRPKLQNELLLFSLLLMYLLLYSLNDLQVSYTSF